MDAQAQSQFTGVVASAIFGNTYQRENEVCSVKSATQSGDPDTPSDNHPLPAQVGIMNYMDSRPLHNV